MLLKSCCWLYELKIIILAQLCVVFDLEAKTMLYIKL